jgi:predicted N-acetyltransferase YhbS
VNIRVAGQTEAEALTVLINDAFREESFFKIGDRIQVDQVRGYFGKGTFFVAGDEDGLAGCVFVELRGERAYLGLLSVSPTRRRQGLGGLLMTHAEAFCREKGCRFVDIDIVNLRTELSPYYQRHGYRETGTAPFPVPERTNMPCHFITMSKELTHSPG